MGTRKTPQQRVEEYRTRAAEIEERERRKLLKRSPQWKATLRAITNMGEALDIIAAGTDEPAHRTALIGARNMLLDCQAEQVG